MAAIRISRLKLFSSFVNPATRFDIRPTFAHASRCYYSRESMNVERSKFPLYSGGSHYKSNSVNVLLGNSGFRSSNSFSGIDPLVNRRFFSSASESKGNATQGSDIIADSGASGASVSNGGIGGDDLIAKFKELWQSTVGAVKYAGEKTQEVSNEMAPYVQQWLDGHPYLKDVIVPVGGTLAVTLFAWSLLPRIFRRFHKYSEEGSGVLLSRSPSWQPVPYEKSFWGALDAPIRFFISFLAILEIGDMVAPNFPALQYAAQASKGVPVVSLMWFLNRWKTNAIARALADKGIERAWRDFLLTSDKVSSVGLIVIGLMALAEAFEIGVQSLLTVGGVGGVAAAFAARDLLGNVLSGLSVQFVQPFSVGDTIKAGSVEGQVVEIGLTTTSLLTAEKFPVLVPNSMFSSQAIVNKSRAQWRSMVRTIPLQIEDIDKISQMSEDIKTMMRSHSNVFLEREAPYCFLSRIERSYAELTIGCNLKEMNKEVEQEILLAAVGIIKQHGGQLGSTQEDSIK